MTAGVQLVLDVPDLALAHEDLDVALADRIAREELAAELAVARPTPTCRCVEGPLVLSDGSTEPPCARCGRRT